MALLLPLLLLQVSAYYLVVTYSLFYPSKVLARCNIRPYHCFEHAVAASDCIVIRTIHRNPHEHDSHRSRRIRLAHHTARIVYHVLSASAGCFNLLPAD